MDDINTNNKYESLEDIIIKSYGEAYSLIVNTYGPDTENWKWGDAHFLTHKHILGKVKILDYLLSLNIGPFKSGGSSLTPNAGGYAFGKDFQQTSGASMRRIVDFSDLNKTKSILPTGQSGLQRSPHYSDQASMYHSGRYRTIKFDERAIKRDNTMRKLLLIPSENQ